MGLWRSWNAVAGPYGDVTTYLLGAQFLADMPTIEDWGCGRGFLKTLLKPDQRYIGIDGSPGLWTEVVADLCSYRSDTPAIFMRHVLEHNLQWKRILANALASFRRKLMLVLFTPFSEETRDIAAKPTLPVPDLSFRREDLDSQIAGFGCESTMQTIPTCTQYGIEHVFRIQKC